MKYYMTVRSHHYISTLLFYVASGFLFLTGTETAAAQNQSVVQKPSIDTSVFGKWPSLAGSNPAISNNGNYASYTIHNHPVGSSTLVLQAIHANWKMAIPGVGNAAITEGSRMAVFITPKDSLTLVTLGTSSVEYISNVRSFRLFKQGNGPDNNEWLAYHLNTPEKELVFWNIKMGKKQSFAGVDSYVLDGDGRNILLITETNRDGTATGAITQVLRWASLSDGKGDSVTASIWESSTATAGDFIFDDKGSQLTFAVEERNNAQNSKQSKKAFWYYKAGTNKAVLLVNDSSTGVDDSGLRLHSIQRFSNDGSRLFFTLKERESQVTPSLNTAEVNVWSYTDAILASQQLKELESPSGGIGSPGDGYAAVINISSRRLIRLQKEDEHITFFDGKPDDVVFVTHRKGDGMEQNWNSASQPSSYLVFTETGQRRSFPNAYPSLSPKGKYLIYSDTLQRNLYSYEIATGVSKNITTNLPIPLIDEEFDESPGPKPRDISLLTWLEKEEAVLIRDKYDVWQLDIAGKRPPINLTNGYGRRNKITFRLAEGFKYRVAQNEELLLSAFNETNKNNGFYRMVVGRQQDPELLIMGPYMYAMPEYGGLPGGFSPLKARDTDIWLVRRESTSESPNWFWTTDFRTYTPLSSNYPERAYNWLASELMTFKTLDGRIAQGVLYKPENFDPKKKYPVIIHYYETMTQRLNVYKWPEAMGDFINIPWFVSNGYLVFTPDIQYTIGEPGHSAYNSVVGAAEHLVRLPWVNPSRVGIQGHSFGGYETNYIVTRTNMFAAAASGAGPSNFTSGYGGLWGDGRSAQGFFEKSQIRMGTTLWQRPDLYIKNSPIFQADKVTTPLLIMHNKEDGAVPFAQGVEWFTGLRRLGKRAWMLEYDGEKHSVGRSKNKKDYTIRVTQFFDHYLKGTLAPKWMTRGVPAKMKGIDYGLELDHEIKTPGPGLLK